MRVLFAGTPEVALPTLQALHESLPRLDELVGRPHRRRCRKGRGRALHASPVAALAREAGLDVHKPATLRDESARIWVRTLDADVAVVVAYGRLIPAALLDIPKHGWLNLHFSLLPAWRGAAPVQRALIAGDTTTGASVFRLEEGMDTGPVYARLTEAIRPTDTSGELLTRLAEAGAPLVLDVLRTLNRGTAAPEPQAEEGVTVAPMLTSADGEIRWSDPAPAIDCRVRGVTPAPGATPSTTAPVCGSDRSQLFPRSLTFYRDNSG